MRLLPCLFVLALALGCSNGRASCHFSSDCASNMHCLNSRCTPNAPDGSADDASTATDGGHDAAFAMTDAAPGSDAGNDAGLDAGHDAGHDAGSDAAARDAAVAHDAAHDAARTTSSAPLLFSEYIEGTSNNKALEIVNRGTATFDLTGCTIVLYANGGTTATATYNLTGSLAANAVFTLCHSGATGFSPATCTASVAGGAVGFNGNDALELNCAGTVDVIGQIGNDPGASGWGTTVSTANQTLRRLCTVTVGDSNGSDPFDPATEWTGLAMDTFSGLGSYGCP